MFGLYRGRATVGEVILSKLPPGTDTYTPTSQNNDSVPARRHQEITPMRGIGGAHVPVIFAVMRRGSLTSAALGFVVLLIQRNPSPNLSLSLKHR